MTTSSSSSTLAPGDTEHLKLLAIFHFILAGVTILIGTFVIIQTLAINRVFAHFSKISALQSQEQPPVADFSHLTWPPIIMGVMVAIVAPALALSGTFLLKRRHRMFLLIVAGLICLWFPFGTVLGVFTIVVLGRDSVRTAFAARHRATS